jgi:N-acetylglucosamine kinase-like BadF-type ATPase
MGMTYILGIDQGSTHTRVAVSDAAGNILGVGKSYGACHSIHGMDKAMVAVREAAAAALHQAGGQLADMAVVFGGFTGADWPDEYLLLQANVLALGLSAVVHISNDSIVALRGGTEASYGAVIIAGTGGNCAIRSPRGEEFIYHYYHDHDLQGGAALGRRALKAVYRAETGRDSATWLTARILEMFGLAQVDDLLRAEVERRLPLNYIHAIAPLVFQTAYEGDYVSGKILRAFGEGLAEMVVAGLRRFKMTNLVVDIVLSGSIFKGVGTLLEEVIIAHIHLAAPKARLVNARYEPVVGAVLLGLEALGTVVDEQVKQKIEESSGRHNLVRLG